MSLKAAEADFLPQLKMMVNFYTVLQIHPFLIHHIWFEAASARDKAKLQRVIKLFFTSLESLILGMLNILVY